MRIFLLNQQLTSKSAISFLKILCRITFKCDEFSIIYKSPKSQSLNFFSTLEKFSSKNRVTIKLTAYLYNHFWLSSLRRNYWKKSSMTFRKAHLFPRIHRPIFLRSGALLCTHRSKMKMRPSTISRTVSAVWLNQIGSFCFLRSIFSLFSIIFARRKEIGFFELFLFFLGV